MPRKPLAPVRSVAAEIALIEEVQTDAFWQDVTLPMLESPRRLRALVKLIEREKRPMRVGEKAGLGLLRAGGR
jgi:type I restriction enzyme R subunit